MTELEFLEKSLAVKKVIVTLDRRVKLSRGELLAFLEISKYERKTMPLYAYIKLQHKWRNSRSGELSEDAIIEFELFESFSNILKDILTCLNLSASSKHYLRVKLNPSSDSELDLLIAILVLYVLEEGRSDRSFFESDVLNEYASNVPELYSFITLYPRWVNDVARRHSNLLFKLGFRNLVALKDAENQSLHPKNQTSKTLDVKLRKNDRKDTRWFIEELLRRKNGIVYNMLYAVVHRVDTYLPECDLLSEVHDKVFEGKFSSRDTAVRNIVRKLPKPVRDLIDESDLFGSLFMCAVLLTLDIELYTSASMNLAVVDSDYLEDETLFLLSMQGKDCLTEVSLEEETSVESAELLKNFVYIQRKKEHESKVKELFGVDIATEIYWS